MSGLQALLATTTGVLGRLKIKVIEPTLTVRAVAKLGGETVAQVDTETVEALQKRMEMAVQADGLSSLSRRDVREGCKVYLHPPHPPGRSAVGEPLIDLVQETGRRAPFFALINAYLDGFEENDESVTALGGRLNKLARTWPWRDGDVWPARAEGFSLFKPAKAPRAIADYVLGSDERPAEALARAGLDTEPRRLGGMAKAAFLAACDLAAELKGAAAKPLQIRLMDWAVIGGSSLSYPQTWPRYAQALFLPWQRAEPDAVHRAALIEAAVKYAGDPRVSQTRWRPVEQLAPGSYEIVLRWLTKASVEQFFDIVSETMTDRPDMWRERRAFWTRYLKKDHIERAWVAFGSDGAHRAERAAQRSGDETLRMFGRLASGGGRTSEHAALIMGMGDLTIVEWSHNGRWNIWPKGAKSLPKLYLSNKRNWPDYEPHDLMNGPLSGPHLGDWQGKVSRIIYDQTGRRP